MVRMGKVGRRALLWLGCMMGLWSPSLWAEVKVIPVFEAQAAVQTLKEIYPQLGVSSMGNQLVLSGTPSQRRCCSNQGTIPQFGDLIS
ncbi:hypothetical protein ACK36H_17350 [Aeromonas veronii]